MMAYLKIVIPLISSFIIVRYMFFEGISKGIIFILFSTYFFVAAQYSIFSFFPINTWVHETINFGVITIYRCISTSGPPTAGGYVLFFLFLVCVHLLQHNKQTTLESTSWFKKIIAQKWLMLVASILTLTRGLIFMSLFSYISGAFKSGKIDRQKFIYMYVFIGVVIFTFIAIIGARIEGGYAIGGDEARIDRLTESFIDIRLSTIIFGDGFGTLYKREVHWYAFDSYDFTLRAPHNMNVLLLLEIGLIRLLGLYYIFVKLFRRFIVRNNTLHAINLVTTLLILFNTETILTFSEYNYAWFVYLISGYYLTDKQGG